MRQKEPGMRHRALTAALPQGRINAAVGQVLRRSGRRAANRMQQAELARLERLEALCIERRILPLRAYRRAAGNIRRYFPLKLPVALDAERAVFVYVEPGHDTATALRSWAKRTWASGGRSASAAGPSRSWPSSALSRSSLGPGRYSAAGQKPPARPNRTPDP